MTGNKLHPDRIEAMPTKTLFVDILTRDVTLRDCIFDLIDNSVDAHIRNGIPERRKVELTITGNKFMIADNCGGIGHDFLTKEVFRFGVEDLKKRESTLGIYGIGLKRALLKIGRNIHMETDDGSDYSRVEWDIDKWKDTKEWTIDFETSKSRIPRGGIGYTKITITSLHKQIQKAFDAPSFINDTNRLVHITYTNFMSKEIDFFLNDTMIEPYEISVRCDGKYSPAKIRESIGDVDVTIACFVDPRRKERKKTRIDPEKRGWNVFFNRRLLLIGDTTPATGWIGGKGNLPKYHSLYNEFRGLVYIDSDDPSKLPVNTAKNGLNTESPVYREILNRMIRTAKPVIVYLSKKYEREKEQVDSVEAEMEAPAAATIRKEEKPRYVTVDEIKDGSKFAAPGKPGPNIKMTPIHFRRNRELVKKVKEHLGVETNKEVGERTFDYFVKQEGIEK